MLIPLERVAAPKEGRWRLLLALLAVGIPLALLAADAPIWWR